jgi:Bacterial Ig-like domain (group 2)/NHL repeat
MLDGKSKSPRHFGIFPRIFAKCPRWIALPIACTLIFGCGGGSNNSGGGNNPLPASATLVVNLPSPGVQLGATEQLQAQLIQPDGTKQDVTNTVTWTSSNSTVALVSAAGVVTPVFPGKMTVTAALQSASVTATADITATKLFGVTDCCPNNFVVLAPSAGTSLAPLPVGDVTTGFSFASATDPVTHHFYIFPAPTAQSSSVSMVTIDTANATVVSTKPLSKQLLTAQFDQKSGNVIGVTACCPNQIVGVDVTNGNATNILNVPSAIAGLLSESAMDQDHEVFYFVGDDTGGVTNVLGVNISTSSLVVQSPLSGPTPFVLAWNANDGTLLGVATKTNPTSNVFVSIDPKSGDENVVGGAIAQPDLQGWTNVSAIDAVRNRFYAVYSDLGNGGPATQASLGVPSAATLDANGNLYIADTGNSRIRKVDTSGVITTFAGSGTPGFSGDGGPATSASLKAPASVACDSAGNLYIADTANNRVRKVDTTGVISTFAGTGTAGFGGDNGPAAAALLSGPDGLAFDSHGNLYISDKSNSRIRVIDGGGTITTFAGNGTTGFSGDGGNATNASLGLPVGLAFDSAGNLFFADGDRIREVLTTGIITTVAGSANFGFSGDGGPATSASLSGPTGVAIDHLGNLLIADTGNSRIRQVDSSGTITTIVGNGNATFGGDGGPAASSSLNAPTDVVFDKSRNLLIVDSANNRIREVNPSAVICTVAGNGTGAYHLAGIDTTSGSVAESLRLPQGVILLGSE